MKKDVFIYRIDRTDKIVSVSDNWSSFADANAWASILSPDDVVGHELWEFIEGIDTRQLYHELFRRVRKGNTSRTIPFRCDSPDERRYLELLIEILPNRQIEITSTILRREPRSPISLLDSDRPKSEHHIKLCSMCKKIEVAPNIWAEIEEGLAKLKSFEHDRSPHVTHGLCRSCYEEAMKELETPGKPKKSI